MSNSEQNQSDDQGKKKFKIILLNVDPAVTKLKLRGWLQNEIQQIQSEMQEQGIVMIRLFLPQNLFHSIPHKELDKILHKLVDRYSCIEAIDMRVVDASLTIEELSIEYDAASSELTDLQNEINLIDGKDSNSPTQSNQK